MYTSIDSLTPGSGNVRGRPVKVTLVYMVEVNENLEVIM